MVRVNAGGGPQNIPPVEELINPDMDIGYPPESLAPPLPGTDTNDQQQVIAPETFDVLARILSLGEQMQPGSQSNYPPNVLPPPSASSSIPLRDNRSSSRPRPAPSGQRHYRDDYAVRILLRSVAIVTCILSRRVVGNDL